MSPAVTPGRSPARRPSRSTRPRSERVAALGSVRAQQGRPRPQALRQPARGRPADGDPARARRLHAAPGRHQHLGGALATRSSPATRATRTCTSIRWKTRSTATRPSTSCPSRSTTCERATMQASITVSREPSVQYLLRIGDTCLILGQRLAEWCGHAPVLEEDIALTNMALDLVGQARAVLTRAGQLEASSAARARRGPARLPARRARLPQPARWSSCRAATSRSRCCATALIATCSEAALGAAARLERRRARRRSPARRVKEARYHQQHAADWVVRLGDGTDESRGAHEGGARRALALHRRDVREPTRSTTQAAAARPRPALGRPARAWLRRDAPTCSPTPACALPAERAVPQHRQARRAQRAHGLHPGRDAAPAARVSRGRVVSGARPRASRRARSSSAWAVLDRVLDPEVPALSVCDLGIVRDVIERDDGARGRRHADLLGLPGHRGDRAEHRRRARRRRPRPGARDACSARRPGPPTGSAPKAGASCATTASRRPGRSTSPSGVPIRFVPRAVAPLACPRCGSTRHRAAVGLRLHRLQGALPLPAPAASRSSTSSRSERRRHDQLHFHPLRVRARRARHRRGGRSSPSTCPTDLRDAFGFTQGQYLTLRSERRRPGPAPLVLDLRRRRRRRAARRHAQGARAACSRTGSTRSLKPGDTHPGDGAAGPLLRAARRRSARATTSASPAAAASRRSCRS